MANEFVARKGIISLGDLTIDTLSGNNGAIITVDADGKLAAGSAGTGLFSGSAQVDHDATTNFVANEHINHANVTLSAGAGLTGGGTIAADRTFAVGAGTGITVNTNDVAIDYAGADNFVLSATDGTSLGNLEGGDKIAFVDLDNNVKYAQVDQLPFNNFTYTHPTHPGDDISIDTTPLTGATVISDLDFNITTDTSGHVTDANGTVSTRTLTLADLGYTGTTDANTYVHPNHTGDVTSAADGATTLAAAAITGKTALTTGLVSTDEFLVSDAGTLKRMDTSVLQTYMQSNLTFTTNTDVDVSAANLVDRLDDIAGNIIIGQGTSTVTIPGSLTVTGTVTTNNVETVSTSNGVIFEGNAADANELTLLAGTLTADQTVTLPDATGTLALDNGSYPNLRAQSTTKGDVGLGNVENTALSTWAGSTNLTTLGTIGTGTWQGTEISTTYTAAKVTSIVAGGGIDVSAATGAVTITAEAASATNPGVIEIATNAEVTTGTDTVRAITPSSLTSITKLGTITTGTWQGSAISTTYISNLSGTNTGDEPDASATVKGIIEIATAAEVTTGTDTVRAITPSSLTSITKLGTIGTGTWQGTKIASAYLDDDTAHLSGTQTFSGAKTFTDAVTISTDSADDVEIFTDYTATVANGTTATIASYTSAAGVAVFFDYRIQDATTNLRAGTVMAISNGSTVAYTEYSTGDIGDTSSVVLSVDYSGGAIRLRAQNDQTAVRTNVFVRTV